MAKSAPQAWTSSGSAPRLWMASMQNSTPRARQCAPSCARSSRSPLAYCTELIANRRVRSSMHVAERLFGRGAARQVDAAGFHALVLQRLPDDAVGREFLIADDHVVARLPGQAMRHDGQRFGRVFQECDVVCGRGIEQAPALFAQTGFRLQPAWVIARPLVQVLLGKALHRLCRTARPGRHRRMVEIDQTGIEREFTR